VKRQLRQAYAPSSKAAELEQIRVEGRIQAKQSEPSQYALQSPQTHSMRGTNQPQPENRCRQDGHQHADRSGEPNAPRRPHQVFAGAANYSVDQTTNASQDDQKTIVGHS